MSKSDKIDVPCAQCPWRIVNQRRRHKFGFYTKSNLNRLWNQIRRGGNPQSCHPTDTTHPDHVASGAKDVGEIRECPGSVIVVMREAGKMADATGHIGDTGVKQYLSDRRGGLTKSGILYWLVQRMTMGGVPFVGGKKLPHVNVDDPEVGLPEFLKL